ncbi:MAG: high frequency lysogenization protein HflD [Thiotrichales bacterium]|nr:MAG: high frequency lysogenization protein HflD [Thiotrichales bacterium]
MKHSKRELALALAGVFQAATLVKQIANTGMANSAVIESSLETLFKFDADSVDEVYGGVAGVSAGIREMNRQFSSTKSERDIDITRYVISMLALEKKLSGNREMLDQIGRTLENIKSGLDYFSLMHENTILKIGQLYKDTISQLSPRIIVSGEQTHLSNENNASRIRALLLAGLRSAILWRQCGGSRLSVLFNRKRYETESTLLLREL